MARCPSLLPSKRSVSGDTGSGSCGHVEVATTIAILLVKPRGEVHVNVPEPPFSMSLIVKRYRRFLSSCDQPDN